MAYQAKDPATLESHGLHGTSLTLGPIYRESLLNRLSSVQKKRGETFQFTQMGRHWCKHIENMVRHGTIETIQVVD